MKKPLNRFVLLFALLACFLCGCTHTQQPVNNAVPQQANIIGPESAQSSSASDSNEALPVLRIGMDGDSAPLNWVQKEEAEGALPLANSDRYICGYEVEMAIALCQQLGVEPEVYLFDRDELANALEEEQIDCILSAQYLELSHSSSIIYTDAYYQSYPVALTTKGNRYESAGGVSALSGATCTALLNTIWYTDCLPQIEKADIITAEHSEEQMLSGLRRGKCDIVVTDKILGLTATAAYSDILMLDFHSTEDTFTVTADHTDLVIVLKAEDTELRDRLNEAISNTGMANNDTLMSRTITSWLQKIANETQATPTQQ